MNPYSYLFYRVYKWKKKSETEMEARVTAFLITGLALNMNLFILLELGLEELFSVNIFEGSTRADSKVAGVITTAIILFLMYLVWGRGTRYQKFCERYSAESIQKGKLRSMFMTLHIILTLVSMIAVPAWLHETRG